MVENGPLPETVTAESVSGILVSVPALPITEFAEDCCGIRATSSTAAPIAKTTFLA
jgi:hypothetical protein